MGGCFGCYVKSHPIIAVDEPSKGLRIQGRVVNKPSISEDFWSTSTWEMDNSTVQSKRSISSVSVSTRTSSLLVAGLLHWNQTRLQWTESKRHEKPRRIWEPILSWNATYESLLGTSRRFPQPIPLAEIVDFLSDIWEQEGLYD
ncbi:unnamed protein product [Ilex paraguariensis]|uniref:Gag1-like clamp domain-containing protein n=1 Tax=Ilex paraguariensis TaxID=185542 RepID=A0ABC8SQD5_9AQUA